MYHKLIPMIILNLGNNQTESGTTGLKHLWQTKEIHVLLLISLSIQVILTHFAPRRKSVASGFLTLVMWLLYLSADAIALYTIGLISKDKFPGDSPQSNPGVPVAQNAELLAFWAPFLLLHLGGPDTITALALQDNELWHRHALQLATQVILTVYVFSRAFTGGKNVGLVLATVFMFVDGCVKYIERTCALYFASVENIRDAISRKPEESTPNYTRLMEEYYSAKSANIPILLKDAVVTRESEFVLDGDDSALEWVDITEETDDMVKDAYTYYLKVQGLLADAYLSLKDQEDSREFFLTKPPAEAIRIIEIELNLVYDLLYTKAYLLQRRRAYARVVCFLAVVTSLGLFSINYKRSNYHVFDVFVTFTLLGGAIALDLFAAIMLIVSDWWVILISSDDTPKLVKSTIMEWLHKLSKMAKNPLRNRWSQSISKYNLLTCCFRDPLSFLKFVYVERIKDLITGLIYVESAPIDKKLVMKFIVKELQTKSKQATDLEGAKEVCSARGNLVFQNEYFLASEYLKPWTLDLDFDASVLTWHLATDICYWTRREGDELITSIELEYRYVSKELSDYMSYLLLRQHSLTAPVMGLSHFRFKDTCLEAKKYSTRMLTPWSTYICAKIRKKVYQVLMRTSIPQNENQRREDEQLFQDFCKEAVEEADFRRTIGVPKGDIANSVLFDACYLAQRLKMFGDKQWEITSKVWVELLSYAATRCSPRSHLAQLSKGGELITVVWLLMAHLGLGDRFMQSQGIRWTKLVIPK